MPLKKSGRLKNDDYSRLCEVMDWQMQHDISGKEIPLEARTDPEGSRKLRLPDFKTIDT